MSSSSPAVPALVDRGPGAECSSLYVHIPFCRDRCTYCAFTTVADDGALHGSLVSAIVAEAAMHAPRIPLQTLYLGGGTPALLSPALLDQLVRSLEARFGFTPSIELTLEANPSNVSRRSLHEWRSLGINRLSVGVQTFRDDVLLRLGRQHDAATSRRALALIGEQWPGTWSADLLMDWKGQHPRDVRQDLQLLLEHAPPHVSVYALTIEPGTPLAAQRASGLSVTAPAHGATRADALWSRPLLDSGYQRYEISNFARPGHRSRHNQVYWTNRSYIGLGPGAASSVHPLRWTNRTDTSGYITAARGRRSVRAATERLDAVSRLMETLAIGLRLEEGLAVAELDARFSSAWRDLLDAGATALLHGGFLQLEAGRLSVAREHRIKVDSVVADLLGRMAPDRVRECTPLGEADLVQAP